MKKILFIAIMFCSIKSYSQRIDLPVLKLTTAPDTSFKFTPGNLLMSVGQFTINYDTAYVNFELHLTGGFDSAIYLSKETFVRWTSRIPFTLWSNAFNTDGTINKSILNQIISPFKLQVQ